MICIQGLDTTTIMSFLKNLRSYLSTKLLFQAAGILSAMLCVYSILGVLQAASLFVGERAQLNFNLWSSLALVFGFATRYFFVASTNHPPETKFKAGFWIIFWLLVVFVNAYLLLHHLVSVDVCLDKGGSFDYMTNFCDFKNSHRVIGLHRTHGFVLTFLLLALIQAILAMYRWRKSSGPL
jgi:hypothetical protein